MTTSTPPAWNWLSECGVPIQVYQYMTSETPSETGLSIDSRNLPVADTFCERNDSTPESAWAYMASRVDVGPNVSCGTVVSCDRKDVRLSSMHADSPNGPSTVRDDNPSVGPREHRIGTCYLDPDTGETVMPGDFFGEKELRWMPDKDGNRHDADPLVTVVESCPECGAVTDIEYEDAGPDTIPLWRQALWLARHIEDLHSPRPDAVSDDELRGMTLIRVLGIGADEHGDEVFRKDSPELRKDRSEEWSDGEFYDLVDRFGDELTFPAKVASSLKSSGPAE